MEQTKANKTMSFSLYFWPGLCIIIIVQESSLRGIVFNIIGKHWVLTFRSNKHLKKIDILHMVQIFTIIKYIKIISNKTIRKSISNILKDILTVKIRNIQQNYIK